MEPDTRGDIIVCTRIMRSDIEHPDTIWQAPDDTTESMMVEPTIFVGDPDSSDNLIGSTRRSSQQRLLDMYPFRSPFQRQTSSSPDETDSDLDNMEPPGHGFNFATGQSALQHSSLPPGEEECLVCVCSSRDGYKFIHPCKRNKEHAYCIECMRTMFLAACKDESRMPPKCCGIIPLKIGLDLLSAADTKLFQSKFEEKMSADRFYCPIPTCSIFIPESLIPRFDISAAKTPENGFLSDFPCPRCTSAICYRCRQISHPGAPCVSAPHDEIGAELLLKWNIKRCPKCGQGVRRMLGCPQMMCTCGANWCWNCSRAWKVCCRLGCTGNTNEMNAEHGDENEVREDLDDSDEVMAVNGARVRHGVPELEFGREPNADDVRHDTWACEHDWYPIEQDAVRGEICHLCWEDIKVLAEPVVNERPGGLRMSFYVPTAGRCTKCETVVCLQCALKKEHNGEELRQAPPPPPLEEIPHRRRSRNMIRNRLRGSSNLDGAREGIRENEQDATFNETPRIRTEIRRTRENFSAEEREFGGGASGIITRRTSRREMSPEERAVERRSQRTFESRPLAQMYTRRQPPFDETSQQHTALDDDSDEDMRQMRRRRLMREDAVIGEVSRTSEREANEDGVDSMSRRRMRIRSRRVRGTGQGGSSTYDGM